MDQIQASYVQNLGIGFEASGITFVNRPYEESLIYVISDDARPEYLIEIDEYGLQHRINIAANLDAEAISYDIKNQTLLILDEGNFSTRKPGRIITLQLDEEGHVATNEGSANILRIQDIPLNPTGTNNGYEALVVDSIQSRIYIGEQDSGRIHCFEFINGEIKERIQTVEAGVNDLSAITLINQGEGRQLLATLHGKSSYINNEFLGPGKSYLQLIDPNTGHHIFSSEITGNFNDLEGMGKIEDKLILTDDAGANGNGKLLSISLNDIISSNPTDPNPPLNQDWQLISSNPDGTLSLWFDPNSQLAAIKNGTDPHQVISRNDSYWSGDIPLNRDQATLIAIARDDNDQIRVLDHGSSGFYGWILDNNATFIGETAYTANDLSSAETTFAIDLDGDGLFNGLLPDPNPPLNQDWQLISSNPDGTLSLWFDPNSQLAAIKNGTDPHQVISRNDSYWSGDIPLNRDQATLIAIARDDNDQIRVLDHGSSGFYGWILDNNATFIGETAYTANDLSSAETTFAIDLDGDGLFNGLLPDPNPPLNQDWQLISSNPDGTLSLWFDPNSQLAAIKNGTDPHQVISRNDSYWSGDIPLNRDQATLIAIARDDNDQIRVLDHGSSGFYGWILDNNATFIGETAYTANDLSSAETTFAIDLDGDGLFNGLLPDPNPPLNQDWQLISSNPDGTLSLWFDPNSQLAAIKNGTDPHQVISRNDSYWSGDIPLNRDQATLIAIARDDNDQIRVLDHGSSGFYGWILDNNATFIGETAYTANDLSSAETTFAIDLDGDGLFNGLLPDPNPPTSNQISLEKRINQLIGDGKLRLTEPDVDAMPKTGTGEVIHPMVAKNFTQAVPSNDWWSSVVFPAFGDAYSAPLYAHPLTIKVEEKGLSLSSQSQREAFQTSDTTWESITPFHRQLQVQVLSEEADGFELITYGDWSFTGGWQQPGDRPELTVAQGSPITWLKGVKANDINISWQGESEEQSLEGSKLNIKINQDHYAVYSSAGIWTQNEGNIRLATEEDAVVDLAVALVPKGATEETIKKFDDSASTRITTTEFGFAKDANPYNISISYEYESQSYPDNTNTLFTIYPHLKNIVNGSFNTGETYESARGQMDLHEGNSFHAEIPALGVLPMLPMVLSESEKEEARAKLLNDSEINNPLSYLNQFGDTYWSGKALLKSIQSAHLAKALGEDDLSAKIVNAVTETLDDWFEASGEANDRHFAYNPIWDTVQGYPDSFGSASQLNDHHFHYGYFIHTAALTGLLNPDWVNTQRDMVDLLINDVAGWNLTDASLPELRNFSTMAGHSWASGHGAFGRGNNHESSSESINFSTGLTLWGGITNRDELTDLGQALYSLEARAIQEYWFDKNQQIHPDGYDVESSGMLWGDGAAHATWFSAEPEHIKGINFLPFSGGSLYLSEMARDPSALIGEIDELTGNEIDQWGGLILQYEALFNQQGALEKKDILIGQLEEGQSEVGVYSWIHALANLGTPTSTIRADHPLSATFKSEDTISYTAFNPGDSPLEVMFNDGYEMTVDPMQLLTQTLDQNAILQENSLSYL